MCYNAVKRKNWSVCLEDLEQDVFPSKTCLLPSIILIPIFPLRCCTVASTSCLLPAHPVVREFVLGWLPVQVVGVFCFDPVGIYRLSWFLFVCFNECVSNIKYLQETSTSTVKLLSLTVSYSFSRWI